MTARKKRGSGGGGAGRARKRRAAPPGEAPRPIAGSSNGLLRTAGPDADGQIPPGASGEDF